MALVQLVCTSGVASFSVERKKQQPNRMEKHFRHFMALFTLTFFLTKHVQKSIKKIKGSAVTTNSQTGSFQLIPGSCDVKAAAVLIHFTLQFPLEFNGCSTQPADMPLDDKQRNISKSENNTLKQFFLHREILFMKARNLVSAGG